MIVFVYSARPGDNNELLKNWRRLNVAFTRARKKLLIVGSQKAMKAIDLTSQLIDELNKKGWIFDFDDSILKNLKF